MKQPITLLSFLTSCLFVLNLHGQLRWTNSSDTIFIDCAYGLNFQEQFQDSLYEYIVSNPGCEAATATILNEDIFDDIYFCLETHAIEVFIEDNCDITISDTIYLSVVNSVMDELDFLLPSNLPTFNCVGDISDDLNIYLEEFCLFTNSYSEIEQISDCEAYKFIYLEVYDLCDNLIFTDEESYFIQDTLKPEWVGQIEDFLPDDIIVSINDCNGFYRFPENIFEDEITGRVWEIFPPQEGLHFTDDCSASFTLIGHPPSEFFPVGITPIQYRVEDECGNALVHEFIVEVTCLECNNGGMICTESCDADESCHYDNCLSLIRGIKGCLPPWDGIVQSWPPSLCDGLGEATNMSWISFDAQFSHYQVYITPSSCDFAHDETVFGMKSGIYDFCEDEDGECIGGTIECSEGLEVVSYGIYDLIVGQTYYLYVTGCEGTVCDYSIQLFPVFINNEPPLIDCTEGTGVVFFEYYCDNNNNGEYEYWIDDYYSPEKPTLSVTPDPMESLYYENKEYHVIIQYVPYEVIQINPDITLVNPPDSIFLDSLNTIQKFYIAVEKEPIDTMSYNLSIAPGFIERCDRVVPFYLKVDNDGTQDFSRRLVFEYENLLELKNYDRTPVEEEERRAVWEVNSIAGSSDVITTYIRMPSVKYQGDNFCVKIYFEDEPDQVITHCFELRCSYDPNDKYGSPNRGGGINYTLFDESLGYTIRFENLGNDTAFNIRVEDPLSRHLDYSSFKYLQSSHTLSDYSIDYTGTLNLYFNNIELPGRQDTINNKGFVQFRIDSRDGLPLKTVIENQAFIYFDSNPAVETNTTQHVLIDEIPEEFMDLDDDGYQGYEDCDDSNPLIYPNASEIPNNDVDEDCDGLALIIDEDQDGFNSDEDCDDSNPLIYPDASEIPNNDIDEDCDGLALIIDDDQDGFNSDEDCDDNNPLIYPDANEIPNNDIDEDCDGLALIIDEDQDGFNSNEDCDDNNPLIYPNANEVPNNDIDEDCDGLALVIDEDQDGFNSDEDCDDNNPLVNTNHEEIPYNGIDDDCNSETLDDDIDQDGFLFAEDCDDNNPLINPNGEEIPNNGIDEDCDGADLITSIKDLSGSGITVYPNPVDHSFNIDSKDKRGRFTLFNIAGKRILSGHVPQSHIDLSHLESGVYLIKFQIGEETYITEIFKK